MVNKLPSHHYQNAMTCSAPQKPKWVFEYVPRLTEEHVPRFVLRNPCRMRLFFRYARKPGAWGLSNDYELRDDATVIQAQVAEAWRLVINDLYERWLLPWERWWRWFFSQPKPREGVAKALAPTKHRKRADGNDKAATSTRRRKRADGGSHLHVAPRVHRAHNHSISRGANKKVEFDLDVSACCKEAVPEPGRMSQCAWKVASSRARTRTRVTHKFPQPNGPRKKGKCLNDPQFRSSCPVACGACTICSDHPQAKAYRAMWEPRPNS